MCRKFADLYLSASFKHGTYISSEEPEYTWQTNFSSPEANTQSVKFTGGGFTTGNNNTEVAYATLSPTDKFTLNATSLKKSEINDKTYTFTVAPKSNLSEGTHEAVLYISSGSNNTGTQYASINLKVVVKKDSALAPVFDPAPGMLFPPSTLSMSSASPNVEVYYTLDGSTPTKSSQKYESSDAALTHLATPQILNIKAIAISSLTEDNRSSLHNSPVSEGRFEISRMGNVLNEDFNGQTASASSKQKATTAGMRESGWAINTNYTYQANGAVVLGSITTGESGSLTTPVLEKLDAKIGDYIVTFYAKKNSTKDYKLYISDGTTNETLNSLTSEWQFYSYTFHNGTPTTKITFSGDEQSPVYLDNVVILQDWQPYAAAYALENNFGERYPTQDTFTTVLMRAGYLVEEAVITVSDTSKRFTIKPELPPSVAIGEKWQNEYTISYAPRTDLGTERGTPAVTDAMTVNIQNNIDNINTTMRVVATTVVCEKPQVETLIRQHSVQFLLDSENPGTYEYQFKTEAQDWGSPLKEGYLIRSTDKGKKKIDSLTAHTPYFFRARKICTTEDMSDWEEVNIITLDYQQAKITLIAPTEDKPVLDDAGFTINYTVSGLALNDIYNDTTPNGYVKITVTGGDTTYSIYTWNPSQRLDFPRSANYTVTIQLYKSDSTAMTGSSADTVRVYTVDFPNVEGLQISPATEKFIEKATVSIACEGEGISIGYKTHPDSAYKPYTGSFDITDSVTVYAFAAKAKMDTARVEQAYYVLRSKIIAPTPRYIDKGSTTMSNNTKTDTFQFQYQYIRSDDSVLMVKISGNRSNEYAEWSYTGTGDGRPYAIGNYGARTTRSSDPYNAKIKIGYTPKLHGFDTAKVVVYNRYARDSFYICRETKATLSTPTIQNKKEGSTPDTVEEPTARLAFEVSNARLAADKDQVKITLRGPVNMDSIADHSPFNLNGLKTGNYTLTAQLVHDRNQAITEEKVISFTVALPKLNKPIITPTSGIKCNEVTVSVSANNSDVSTFYSVDSGKTYQAYTASINWNTQGKTSFMAMVTKAGYDTAWSDMVSYTIEKTSVTVADTNLGETTTNLAKAIPLKYSYASRDLRVEIVRATRPNVFAIDESENLSLNDSVLTVNSCKAEITESITFAYNAPTYGKDTAWVKVYNDDVNKTSEYTFFVAAETKAEFTYVKPDHTGDFTNRDTLLVEIAVNKVELGEDKDSICMIMEGKNTLERYTQKTASLNYKFENLKTDEYTLTVALVSNSGDTLHKKVLTPIQIKRTPVAKPTFVNSSGIYCRQVNVAVTVPAPDASATLEYATASKASGPWSEWQPFTPHDYKASDTIYYKVRASVEHKDATESSVVWYKVPTPVINPIADVYMDSTSEEKSTEITIGYQYLTRNLSVDFVKNGRSGSAFILSGGDFFKGDGDSIKVHNTCQPAQNSSFTITYHPTVHGSDTAIIKVWNPVEEKAFRVIAYAKPAISIERPLSGELVVDCDSIRVICNVTNAKLEEGADKVRMRVRGHSKGYDSTYTGTDSYHDFTGLLTDDYTLTVELLNKNSEVIASATRSGSLTRKKVQAPEFEPEGGNTKTYSNHVEVTISSSTPDAEIWYTTQPNDGAESEWKLYSAPIDHKVLGTTVFRAKAIKARMDTSNISTTSYKVARSLISFSPVAIDSTKDSTKDSTEAVIEVQYAHLTEDLNVEITQCERDGTFKFYKNSEHFNKTSTTKGTLNVDKDAEGSGEVDIRYNSPRWGADSAKIRFYSADVDTTLTVYGYTKATFRISTPTENQTISADSVKVSYLIRKANPGEHSKIALALTGPKGTVRDTAYSTSYVYKNLVSGSYTLRATLIEKDENFVVDTTAPRHFKIDLPNVATPTLSRTSGSYPDSVLVSINCATNGAGIFYTLDNGITWTPYSNPVKLEYNKETGASITHNLQAKAVKKGMDTSALTSVYKYKVVKATYRNIAELKEKVFDQTIDTVVYRLTDPVLVTVQGLQNRRLWVQDTTGEDRAGLALTNFGGNYENIYTKTKLTGLRGRLSKDSVNKMILSATPTNLGIDPKTELKAKEVTIAALKANAESYQNKYVTIRNVRFSGVEAHETFENVNKTYTLKGLGDNAGQDLPFLSMSYLHNDVDIETDPVDITGIILLTRNERLPRIGTDTVTKIVRRAQPAVNAGADMSLADIYSTQSATRKFSLQHKDISGDISVKLVKNTGGYFTLNKPAEGKFAATSGRDWKKTDSAQITYSARPEDEVIAAQRDISDTAWVEMAYTGAGFDLRDTVAVYAKTVWCNKVPATFKFTRHPYTVSIDWDGSTVDTYQYQYRIKNGESEWTEAKTITSSAVTLNNLIADTSYQFKVSRQCIPGVWSQYADTSFRTSQGHEASIEIYEPEHDAQITTDTFTVRTHITNFLLGTESSAELKAGYVRLSVNGVARAEKIYDSAFRIEVERSGDYTVRVELVEEDEEVNEELQASETPRIDERTYTVDFPDVAPVRFTPKDSTYITRVEITEWACDTSDATVYYKTRTGDEYSALEADKHFIITQDTLIYTMAVKAKRDTAFDTARYYIVQPKLYTVRPNINLNNTNTSLPNRFAAIHYSNLTRNITVDTHSTRPGVFRFTAGMTDGEINIRKGLSDDYTDTLRFNYNAPRYGKDTLKVTLSSEQKDAAGKNLSYTFRIIAATVPTLSMETPDEPDVENISADSLKLTFTVTKATLSAALERVKLELKGKNRDTLLRTLYAEDVNYMLRNLRSDEYHLVYTLVDKDGKALLEPGELDFTVGLPQIEGLAFVNAPYYCNTAPIEINCNDNEAKIYYTVDSGATWTLYTEQFVWNTIGTTVFKARAVKPHTDTAETDYVEYVIHKSFVGVPNVNLDPTKSSKDGEVSVSYAYVNENLKVEVQNTPAGRTNPFTFKGLIGSNNPQDTLSIENKCTTDHSEDLKFTYDAPRYGYDTAKVSLKGAYVDTFFYIYARTLPTFRVSKPEQNGHFTRDSIEVDYLFNKVDLADNKEYVHVILKGEKYGLVKDTLLRGKPYKITGLRSDTYTLIDTLFDNSGKVVDTTAKRTFTINLPNVEKPKFTEPTASYANRVNVEISTETEGAAIYYSVNGGEWTSYETVFVCSNSGMNEFVAMAVKAHTDTAWSDTVRYNILNSKVWFAQKVYDLGATKDSISSQVEVHYQNLSDNLGLRFIEPTTRKEAFKWKVSNDTIAIDHKGVGESSVNLSLVYKADRYGEDTAYILIGNKDCYDTLRIAARTKATFRHLTPPVPENGAIVTTDSIKVDFNVRKATIAEGYEQVHLKLKGQKQGLVKDTLLRDRPISFHNLRSDIYTLYDTLLSNSGVCVDTTASRTFTVNLPDVQTPTISPASGIYANALEATITCGEADAVVYYTVNDGITWTEYTDPITIESTANLQAMAVKPRMDTAWSDTAKYTVVKSQLEMVNTELGSTQTQITEGLVTFNYTNISAPIYVEIGNTTRSGNAEFRLVTSGSCPSFTKESDTKGKIEVSVDLAQDATPVKKKFAIFYQAQTHGFDTAEVRIYSKNTYNVTLVDTTVKVAARTRTRFRIAGLTPEPQNSGDADSVTIRFNVSKADIGAGADRIRLCLKDTNRNKLFDTIFDAREYNNQCKITGLKTGTYVLYDTLYHTDGKMIDTTSPRRFSIDLPDVEKPWFDATTATYGDSVKITMGSSTSNAKIYYTVNDGADWTLYEAPFVWRNIGTYTFKAMAVKAHADTSYSSTNPKITIAKVTYNSLAELKREVYEKKIVKNLTYTVTGDVTVTGVHNSQSQKRFWVQDADRNQHGAIVVNNYDKNWNLKVGDKLNGLRGTLSVDTIGEARDCNGKHYAKQPYRKFSLSGSPVVDGTATPYTDTVTYDTVMNKHYDWQSRLVCIRNVRFEDVSGTYMWAQRSYADGNESHKFYVDVQDNETFTGKPIEPDSFNVTGLVQIRQLNDNTILCDETAYGTVFPRDTNDIDRIPQPGVEAGDNLRLPFIFQDKVDTAVAIQSKDVHGEITVALGKNTHNSFTLNTAEITANSGRNFDTADTKLSLTYNFRTEGGLDTAMVVISYGKWRDSMYVFAESRLCVAPSTRFKVVDSVISATLTFDSVAAEYKYRYATSRAELASATASAAFDKESFFLDDLKAATKYYYQLQSWCGTDAHSDWSKVDSFTTRQPELVIKKPEDGHKYTGVMDMEFTVKNMRLGYEAPASAPANHLPYGWANMQLFRQMEHLNNKYVRVAYTDSILNPTNRRLIPSGKYHLKITLVTDNPKAQGDSAKFVQEINYTVDLPDLPKPKFNPAPGTYNDSLQVSITCDTASALLFYSYDGTNYLPYETGNRPWIKPGQTTLYAKAVKTGYDTAVFKGTYTLRSLCKLSSIAALYEAEPGYIHGEVNTNQYYRIDGDMAVTYVDSSGTTTCRIFVQDIDKTKEHGRSLVMLLPETHNNVHVTDASIREGDVISGVMGRVSASGNLMRFTLVDSAIVPKEHNHSLFVDTLTVPEFRARTTPHQGDLVCVKYVHFASYLNAFDETSDITMSGKGDGVINSFSFHPSFKFADYMPASGSKDTLIPKDKELFLTGILSKITPNEDGGKEQFTPRGWRDFALAPYLKLDHKVTTMPVVYGGSAKDSVPYRFGNWSPEDLGYDFTVNGEDISVHNIFRTVAFGSEPLDPETGEYEGKFGFGYRFQNDDRDDTLTVALSLYDLKDTAYLIGRSRLCREPQPAVTVGPHFANIIFGEDSDEDALWFEIDTMLSTAENTPVWDDEHVQYEHLKFSKHEFEIENLRYRNTYYYRSRKACATIESAAGVKDSVIYSPWVVDSFMTQYETTPTIRLLSPKADSTYSGALTVSFKVSVKLGTDPVEGEGVVRISIVDQKTHDTILRDWVTDTTYDCFINRSGDYTAGVLLMKKDSTMRTDFAEVGAIVARRDFSIDLPDIAVKPIIAVKDAKPCGVGHIYYDSVRIEISCAARHDSLLFKTGSTTWKRYTEPFWITSSTKVYAMAVKDSMDAVDTAIDIQIVSNPMLIKSAVNHYEYSVSIDDWSDWYVDNLNVEFDYLRDTMYFVVKPEDGREPIVKLDREWEPTNTNTVVNNMARTVSSLADLESPYPSIREGVYHDTLLYIVQNKVVYKVTLTFTITNFDVPGVKITPESSTHERRVEVAMNWDGSMVSDERKPEAKKVEEYYEIHYTLDGSTPTFELVDGKCFKYKPAEGLVLIDSTRADTAITVKALGFDSKQVDSVHSEWMDSAVYHITNRAIVNAVEAEELFYTRNILEALEDTLHYTAKFLTGKVNVNIRPRSADAVTAIEAVPVGNIGAGTLSFKLSLNRDMELMPGEYQDTIVLTSAGRELKRTIVNLTVTYFTVPKVKITPAAGSYEHEVEISFACESEQHPGYKYQIRYTLTANDRPSRDKGTIYKGTPVKQTLASDRASTTFTVRALAFDPTRKDSTFADDSMAVAIYTLTHTPRIIGDDTLLSYTLTTEQTLNKQLSYTAVNLFKDVRVSVSPRAEDTITPIKVTPDKIESGSDEITLTLKTEGAQPAGGLLPAGRYQDTILMTYLDGSEKVLKRIVVNLYVKPQKLPAPVFTPEPGFYYDSVEVALACEDDEATIMCRINDTGTFRAIPAGSVWTIKDTVTFYAFACQEGRLNSDTIEAVYYVMPTPEPEPELDTVATPYFLPPADVVYDDSVWVFVSCDTQGARIWYSLDSGEFMAYSGAFKLSDTTLVMAYAVKEGLVGSDTARALYRVRRTVEPEPEPEPEHDTVATPVITPSAETEYADSVQISISCATSGTQIWYSLNEGGFMPYIGSFYLRDTTYVMAYALQGYLRSDTVRALYRVRRTVEPEPEPSQDSVSAPVFSPSAAEEYMDSVWVSISCSTEGAGIKYSLDYGEMRFYEGPFLLRESTLVSAFSFKSGTLGIIYSDTVEAEYTVRFSDPERVEKVKNPVIAPSSNIHKDSVWVSISCATADADILYSIGGESLSLYYEGPFCLRQTGEVRAVGVKEGFENSDTVSMVYIIEIQGDSDLRQVESPVFTPSGGEYIDSVRVSIASSTEGSSIYYSVDGGEPNTPYVEALHLTTTTTVRAIAVKPGWLNSEVKSETYVVIPDNPEDTVSTPTITVVSETLDEESGMYNDYVIFTVSCATPEAEVVYSLDGTQPSIPYTGAVTLKSTATVRAMGKREGWVDSRIAEVTYIVKPSDPDADTLPAPVFSPLPGEYRDEVRVSLSCEVEDAVIWYSLDGSIPTKVYRRPIPLSKSTTVLAFATKSGAYYDSRIVSGTYIILPDEPEVERVEAPVFEPEEGEYADSVEVRLSCETPGAAILYSLSGEEPATVYNGPITLKYSTEVKAKAVKEGMLESETVEALYEITHQDLELKAYPMPSDGNFTVELNEPARVDIINLQGVVVWSRDLGAGTHEVRIGVTGYYVLRATTGKRSAVETIVIL